MYYSDEIVEEVRARNDIVEVVSGYVRLQKKGGRYWGLCPFHNEKSPSFSVNGDMQVYHCFGCGAGGNVYTFVMNYENYSFPEAVRMLELPWFPIVTPLAEVLLPVFAAALSATGLALVFGNTDD